MKAWPRRAWGLLDDPERLEMLLEPREMDVTVIFCDLRNFSRFAEQGKTTLLDAWRQLSLALDEMSRTITDHDGVVAGFQGDAVMGFWGWPEAQDRQVELAARAALRIHDRFAGVLKEFKCGLGLAHGRAVAGRLGAHDLAKVDVYGPVVNLASRLEGLTKIYGVNIMVNDAVADQLKAADPAGSRYRLRKLSRLRPKGMQDAFLVSELFSPQGPAAVQMNVNRQRTWDQAVDWFLEGKWVESYERLAQFFRDDGPGKCLMDFMDKANRTPPPNWEGVITFTTKE
jgi:adenylate cyclase